MKTIKFLKISKITAYIFIFFCLACQNSNTNVDNELVYEIETDIINQTHLDIIPLEMSLEFPEASLEIIKMQSKNDTEGSVILSVNYVLRNFMLTKNTKDENSIILANSEKGQHIHFILDNAEYQAIYTPENSVKLKKGTKHYLLFFLSRSYHESLKQSGTFALKHFEITETGKYVELAIDSTPMMFYSRPKGEYIGADCKSILLDFYLVNTDLDKDRNKIKAVINEKVFYIDNWQAYKIEGLPRGENTISLTLVDSNNIPIEGDFNNTSRKIILTK